MTLGASHRALTWGGGCQIVGESHARRMPVTTLAEHRTFDPLDMHHYRMENLPVRERSAVELWIARVGAPLAIVAFALVMWVIPWSFLDQVDPATLGKKARELYHSLGPAGFARVNVAMLAVFVGSIILWMTEAIPNYLTSLIVIITMVFAKILPEKVAYAQLGHEVMWLNILSFILASMLVATGVAKRFALWFILKFGRSATSIFLSFLVINVILSAFISATTAKAAILLPIFMVVAAVYGATGGKHKNNFGRNLVLQNLFCINIGASGFKTGSGANLLACSLLAPVVGRELFFQEWLVVAFPLSLLLMILGWLVGTRIIFPVPPAEQTPHVEGGMESLQKALDEMGPVQRGEVKSVVLFLIILALWATDQIHGISATAVAFVGAIVALLPGIGIVRWDEVDIPWHLLMFSAGAYTLGEGLAVTDLPNLSVRAAFNALGLTQGTPFWLLYLVLTGSMMFSALVFQSKTMRTMIFVPIALGVAQKFGYPPLSLALPVALLIEHVYVLPSTASRHCCSIRPISTASPTPSSSASP